VGGVEEAASLWVPGQEILAWYNSDDVWHHRLVLAHVTGKSYVIMTPDQDVYVENLPGRDGASKVLIVKSNTDWPETEEEQYLFEERPGTEELQSALVEAQKVAEAACRRRRVDYVAAESFMDESGRVFPIVDFLQGRHRRLRGKSHPSLLMAPGPPGGKKSQEEERTLIALDPSDGLPAGSETIAENTDVVLDSLFRARKTKDGWVRLKFMTATEAVSFATRLVGTKAVVAEPTDLLARLDARARVGDEVKTTAEDVRTLAVEWDEQGERFKEWRRAVGESTTQNFSESPLDGPAVCLHLCKMMQRTGGDPHRWLEEWARTKKIDEKDRIFHEMQTLTDLLYQAGTFDALNLGGLVSLEVAARRVAAIVDAYADPSRITWTHAKFYSSNTSVEAAVPQAFRAWAVRRARDDTDLRVKKPGPAYTDDSQNGGSASSDTPGSKGGGRGRRGRGGGAGQP